MRNLFSACARLPKVLSGIYDTSVSPDIPIVIGTAAQLKSVAAIKAMTVAGTIVTRTEVTRRHTGRSSAV